MNSIELSVIIPTYKEEKRLGKTLENVTDFLGKIVSDFEIIIVDDNSPDNTIKVAKGFGNKKIKIIKNPKRVGKGASVRIGIEKSKYPLMLITDADLSTPIEEVSKLLKNKGRNDIVIGSRRSKDSDIKKSQPMKRSFFGKMFVLLTRIVLGLDFEDTQCGFKLMEAKAARDIFRIQKISGYCFDAEILFIAKKSGFLVKEVGTKWLDNPEESKIRPVRDGLKMLADLLRIRLMWSAGLYK
ncbi:MAG: glycosyltransferase [Candidatus Aenigmarchaeota archaeon]|nr:glycosyltransferase [Candidatus Aenigmarchaeota archaeon]